MSEINEELTKEKVEKKVSDWKNTIQSLYAFIQKSLEDESNIEFDQKHFITMYEELMRTYNLRPEHVPILEIKKKHTPVMMFKPVGLWVIGADGGRVDVMTSGASFMLINASKPDQEPEWRVYTRNKTLFSKFTPTFIKDQVSKA